MYVRILLCSKFIGEKTGSSEKNVDIAIERNVLLVPNKGKTKVGKFKNV